MKKILFGLILFGLSIQIFAYDKSKLTEDWQHTPFELYLDAQEAYNLKFYNPYTVLLLDVRNQAELHYTGVPKLMDANIPYKFDTTEWISTDNGKSGTFQMKSNPNFVADVENVLKIKKMNKENPIIIMCATGARAPFAVKKLYQAGFKKVYVQVEGFEGIRAKKGNNKGKRVVSGWKVRDLPWSYKLPTKKMYFNFKTTID
jgi:rhodanese-related sulfurtransferase